MQPNHESRHLAGTARRSAAPLRRVFGGLGRAIMASAMLLASGGALQPQVVLGQACGNPIACENQQPGAPLSQWDVQGGPDLNIVGFTNDISYTAGATVTFKINTPASAYKIDIYRLGYYGGAGARQWGTATITAPTLPQTQPACLADATGLVDCGNWAPSATWTIPANAVSGVYLAKATRTDTFSGPGSNHIVFVVRDDASNADLVFQTSDTTWQAYNQYGGNSLYAGAPAGRAFKVSYNRPITTNSTKPETFLFASETPMIRWIEANGYNVSYISGVDTDRGGAAPLKNHKVFLSVGHDEYWSGGQRANVEAARDAGTNLAFFSGNEVFWKTRYENSIDPTATAYRTLVSYKETQGAVDPLPNVSTGTWRDPRKTGADGGRPENALTGNLFMVNGTDYRALQVPASYGMLRFWRNTAVRTNSLTSQPTTLGATCNCVLGYEWDAEYDNGFRPAGLIEMSSSTYNVNTLLQDYGTIYAPGSATHHLTLYRAPSGALVFGAGTLNWAVGLDVVHSGPGSTVEVAMQQATVNLFADMGVQAGSLQSGLIATTASTDTAAPTSSILSPAANVTVNGNTDVTISGSASDAGGGVVGSVEVSVDNGTTWHPASGTNNWSYTWRVTSPPGPTTIKTRASDDSANVETPGAGVAVTVGAAVCPCTIFRATDAGPPAGSDAQAIQVGVKFRTDVAGYINGIRFYKGGTANGGTHLGTLWSGTGQKLATATFTGETATGWQQALFSTPIAVTAGTTYVASYFAPQGGYSATLLTFANSVDNAPLHALRDGLDGPNGVYQYVNAVPNTPTWSTFNSANYWVDAIFNTVFSDGVPPTVNGTASTSSATGLPLDATPSATFSEPIKDTTKSLTLADPSGAVLAGQVTYDNNTLTETFQASGPLALNTQYTATIAGVQDVSGNTMAAPFIYTLSTPACPCSLWNDTTIPAVLSQPDGNSVEVGMHFLTHVDGYVTGVRFFQGPSNTGTHIGNLWSSTGQNLATVTFPASSTVGWQTASFSPAVYVQPGTDYVISYHANSGGYSVNSGYFGTIATDVGPLKAPVSVTTNGSTAANGVYLYGAGGFPTNHTGSNYWIDPIFAPGGAAVQIQSNTQTKIDQTTASLAWVTDKLSDSLLVYGTATGVYNLSTLLDTKQVTSHTASLTGLTPNTKYYYQLKSRDSAGNQATSTELSFTTAPIPDTTPPIITAIVKNGENSSTKQLITWTTNEPSDTRLAHGVTSTYGPQPPIIVDTTSAVTSHSVELTGLSPSTTYHFQIGSQDPSLNLAQQPDDTFVTGDVQISVPTVQLDPANPDIAATISWTGDAAADTVLDYAAPGQSSTHVAVANPVTSHTVNLTGLTPGTTYTYQASSTVSGHTASSASLTFTTTDHTAPKITNITPSQVDIHTETIAWTTDENATSEVDYYSTDPTHPTVVSDTALVKSHSLTLNGLTPGTMYHYVVKSVDASGNPGTTAPDTFTSKQQNPPQITSGPTVTVTYNTATIVWGTSVASDTQVKYGTSASYGSLSPSPNPDPTPRTSHSVGLSGLSASTTYHYQVLSRDPATNLLASSPDSTFTTPAAPDTTPPVLTGVLPVTTTSSATITWTSSELADTQVEFGLTTSYGSSTTLDKTLVTSHSVTLGVLPSAALTPNTTYYFKVKSADAAKNPATVTGSFTTLPLPRSLSLNGTTAYAEAPNASEVNVTGDLTVETWFKDTTVVNGVATYNHLPTAILVKGDVVTDKEVPFAIGIAFNQIFITEKSNNSFSYMYFDLAKNKVTPNAWHHLAFSVEASTHMAALYIDGIPVMQGTLSSVSTLGNTKPITFGRNGASTGYGNFRGNLDDVRVWNKVRTPSQIAGSYLSELNGAQLTQAIQSGLVGTWKFNEGSGTTAGDATATPQNATLYGGATWSTDVHTP
jgi:phosphodiesterase/alkaline phosphatase D-like protein